MMRLCTRCVTPETHETEDIKREHLDGQKVVDLIHELAKDDYLRNEPNGLGTGNSGKN